MKVIGLDPGPVRSAVVRLDGRAIIERVLIDNRPMLGVIRHLAFISEPDEPLVIEQLVSYGMSVGQTIFETAMWSGRFAQVWADEKGVEPLWLPRTEVKLRLCGTRRANDRDIREALTRDLGMPGTKHAQGPTYGITKDLWSALAVARASQEPS